MPHLYCDQHGKEHEARVIGQRAVYRGDGESVLIVKGRLITGGWLCDRCNAPLGKGNRAYLLTVFPRWIAERMQGYDFAYERQYFAVERADVAVYGAEWRGGDPATDL